ncbi:MAG: MBL fold metallo-hydrolase [Bryobacteraceae bacterium]
MKEDINIQTLRDWLDSNQPVTVLDIRSQQDREQWSIPGSLHVDAYDELRAGRPGPLAGLTFPADAPIVTICNAGRISRVAAEVLRERGLNAASLEGGMKAWSPAWNMAEVPLGIDNVSVLQVRRTGKGCLSYIVGSDREAAVIDASLPPEVYTGIASERGWRIRFVLDTHVHADHLSRSRSLAALAGALPFLPPQQRVRFPFHPVDSDRLIRFGAAELRVIPTPGHTPESVTYSLNGAALFTGDTLFLAGVGRPDLHTDEAGARRRISVLYNSLRALLTIDPAAAVLPGHVSEPIPFDRRPISATLAEVSARVSPWLADEESFAARLLKAIPLTPPNYERIIELNEAGVLPENDPTDLEAGANRCAIS